MNSVGALLTVFFCVAVATVRRPFVGIFYLAAVLYITQGQAVDLGINFMAIRFIEIAAFTRVVVRGELSRVRFTSVDKCLAASLGVLVLAGGVRQGLVDWYQLGIFTDALLVFLTFRATFSDLDDVILFAKGAAILLVPFAVLMVVEGATGRNLFSTMGGVPEQPVLREGHYRSQGSFRHAISAGTLGASFAPFFTGFFFRKGGKLLSFLGLACCIAIVIASHSSGPLMAAIAGIAAWICWFLRARMRLVRWGIVSVLIALHMAMSKPVWFIFDRISGIIGGDGWHRSNLIDQFFKHAGQWWIAGMAVEDTGSWAATKMPWGGVDVTNYYISLGLAGGLLPLVLFLAMIVAFFKLAGRSLAVSEEPTEAYPIEDKALLWGIYSCVLVHVVNLTAVVYFDQSYVLLYGQLGIAVSLACYHLKRTPLPELNDSISQAGDLNANAIEPVQ